MFYVADSRPWLPDVAVGLLEARSGAWAKGWLSWEWGDVEVEDAVGRGELAESLGKGLEEWRRTSRVGQVGVNFS